MSILQGGRYYFYEHLMDEYISTRRKIQRFLTWTNIWPWIFDGCKFQPLRAEISLSGFSKVDYNEFELDYSNLKGKSKMLIALMAPHIVGVARK